MPVLRKDIEWILGKDSQISPMPLTQSPPTQCLCQKSQEATPTTGLLSFEQGLEVPYP